MIEAIINFLKTTGVYAKCSPARRGWKYVVMYILIGLLFYLAIWRKFEPLLLLPIAFGMLLANLPGVRAVPHGILHGRQSRLRIYPHTMAGCLTSSI
jgi:Na+-transporting methylmalonyl-CoA/oxaloacetate decarboxylase beta subunit